MAKVKSGRKNSKQSLRSEPAGLAFLPTSLIKILILVLGMMVGAGGAAALKAFFLPDDSLTEVETTTIEAEAKEEPRVKPSRAKVSEREVGTPNTQPEAVATLKSPTVSAPRAPILAPPVAPRIAAVRPSVAKAPSKQKALPASIQLAKAAAQQPAALVRPAVIVHSPDKPLPMAAVTPSPLAPKAILIREGVAPSPETYPAVEMSQEPQLAPQKAVEESIDFEIAEVKEPAPKAIKIAARVGADSGFKSRLKKSKKPQVAESEERAETTATSLFQDRLRKSVK